LPFGLDAFFNKSFGRKNLVEFFGTDVRVPEIERKRNPYYPGNKLWSDTPPDPEKKMRRWASLTDGIAITSDHSFNEQLLTYYNTVYIIGQRTDISSFIPSYPSNVQTCPVIVHAPSHSGVKGTQHIENALDKLKSKGVQFQYLQVTGMSHQEARKSYVKADIIVDQLLIGSHGIFACEGMAMGKPVICYIMDDIKDGFPENFPIINANPDTIEDVLLKWINSPKLRRKQGKLSRKYAEEVHDHIKVAKRLEVIYENHLNNTHPSGVVDMRNMHCNS